MPTATESTDGTNLTYTWDFDDDGATADGATASYEFNSDGVYNVVITTTDECNFSETAELVVTIDPPNLVADFDQTPTELILGSTAYFTDTSTTDGPAIVEWDWDFGDEEIGCGANTSHEYMATGSYTVTLTVTDSLGYTDSATSTVTVEEASSFLYLPIIIKNNE